MPVSVLLLILLFCSARADDISLIRVTDNWKYFEGRAEPPGQPLSWIDLNYDDSQWAESLAGFSSFNTYGEATQLYDYGRDYSTVYFRRKFSVSDPATVAQLIFRIDYDDGFIAYLNGIEMCRRGIAGESPIPLRSYAAIHPRGPTEAIDVSASLPALNSGTNVLAIQLFGSATNDYQMCMVGDLKANFLRAPYIQNTTSNSTYIVWKTLSAASAYVEFGTNVLSPARLDVDVLQTNHVAILTNLIPDTVYFYRAGALLNGKEAFCDWRSFRTLKTAGPVSFEVVGDSGWPGNGQFSIARELLEHNKDLVFHVGDIVYFSFNYDTADFRFFGIYEEQLRSTPYFFAIGNHDDYQDLAALIASVYLPTNSATGTEHYYSFDHGDVHFVALWLDLQAGVNYSPGSVEYNWLEQDLAGTQKPWKVVFFHHTWRSSSGHGNFDDYDANGVLDSIQIQNSVIQLANRYGVQIVFNGHDHTYERLTPSGGTVSFVSGGGGAILYPFSHAHPDDVQFYSTYNFLTVNIDGDEAEINGINASNTILDSFHYRKSFPDRKLWTSAWDSPRIEAAPANDGDGNQVGQSFDFNGTAVPARTGTFSATGRLFVNNDDDFLYLGIDETALRSDENLFLFVEADKLPGVTNMTQVGNSTIDPQGEGVDGLDFLKNLSFTNFSPSVAILLGDEFADGPMRSFVRPALSLDIGQGAFYLTNGFPAVPGQKLQQFNRSPQTLPAATYEQNANYIKVAIPFSSLGNTEPGGTVKLALIAGLGGYDTNTFTRALDVGGVALNIATNGNLTLVEPVEVLLALNPDPSLRLRVYAGSAPGSIELKWNTIPGRSYQLQFSETLVNDWQDLPDASFPKVAAGPSDSYLISQTAPISRYYRAVLLP
jgi:hypothetical protein